MASPTASLIVAAGPLSETIDFFVDELGFQLARISPADDPKVAVVTGHGLTLQLDSASSATPTLKLPTGRAADRTAPNGMVVSGVDPGQDYVLPDLVPELVISRAGDADAVIGRAGMRYRDLIPSRLGGRFIASHIEVCDGGPVPDLVHHHAIRFQMIFCHRGWVDVVYQDQGAPFRLEAGDCVLQPPHIRHRVLASSAGAQVVEIGCPAEHDTFFDHELDLPTAEFVPDRVFGGQIFMRHQASNASWEPSHYDGLEVQRTQIQEATDGLARVTVLRPSIGVCAPEQHDGEFLFFFVLDGSASFAVEHQSPVVLAVGDSVAIPAGFQWQFSDLAADLRLLEVALP